VSDEQPPPRWDWPPDSSGTETAPQAAEGTPSPDRGESSGLGEPSEPSESAGPAQPGETAHAGFGQPFAAHDPYAAPAPHQPAYYGWQPPQRPTTARVPVWLWPAIAVLALVLGVSGGAVAGYLVADHQNGGDTPGGVLQVQRRTAAPLPADNKSIPAVARKVLPSTVQIIAEYKGDPQGATGSGWVFDKQGHIITNNHVVAEAAGDNGPIEVIDQAGRHFKATVIGRSAVYDVAVLKADAATSLTPIALGSAEQMNVGETVVAIGSPLGLSATVTSGIVSAVDRPVTTGDGSDSSFINAIQTNAAINPGNSGGPLVNLQGEVVGVNSAIASLGSAVGSDESGSIGVGFAIPIEQVEVTTDQILRTGKARYPVIGATVRGTSTLTGARITDVSSGSPAQKAGLEVGDLITAVDGKHVSGSSDVVVQIRTHAPGETVTLTVKRGSAERQVKVKLGSKVG
jgi:putative serine protease PepD